MKKRSRYEFVLTDDLKETIVGPSKTVPDDTLSIREIMQRHAAGQRVIEDLQRNPVYDDMADFDSPDLEKLQNLDMFELEEYRREVNDRLDYLKSKIPKKSPSTSTEKRDKKPQVGDQRQEDEPSAATNDEGVRQQAGESDES